MAFKMKGNPMQRNFGIGSPMNKKKRYQYTETPEPTKDEKMAFNSEIQNVTSMSGQREKAKSYIDKSKARTKEGYEKDYREGLRKGQRRRYDKAMASGKERKISKQLDKRAEAYSKRGINQEKTAEYTKQDMGRVTKPRRRKK
jgi:hypothetical protein